MKVTMLVKNSFEYDARVTREARALIGAGHEVTVIAIHVPGVTASRERRPDGIDVVRVSRLNLGVDAVNRLAARYADSVERRHATLTGEPYDASRVRRLSLIHPPSTATPGAAPQPQTSSPASDQDEQPASFRLRAWAKVSTALLVSIIAMARFGVRAVRAVLGRQGRALKTWAINRRMIRAGLATAADVFHSHDLNTLYVGWRCKRATGARLVYDSHELATERNRMGFWWRTWASWNERRWIRHADAVIVASPSWRGYLVERHPSIPEPMTLLNVPEPVEITPRDLRTELGIDHGVPVLVYQGSIQENRGIEPAIDAIALLDDAVLVVIGYGHHRPVLEALVERRAMTSRVRFFGPIANDELLAYTASADIGLCNIVNSSLSYFTSLPNKLFEYILAGLPVIGSDSPEIGRVVRETGIGEVCDPVDPDALASAARKILDDPQPYRSAAVRAARRYNWGVERQKLLDLYDSFGA